eukprot:2143697-Pleurochrysis_carterae.AAC.1
MLDHMKAFHHHVPSLSDHSGAKFAYHCAEALSTAAAEYRVANETYALQVQSYLLEGYSDMRYDNFCSSADVSR